MDKRKYKDRPETIKKAVARRRRKLKLMAVEYLGGKCTRCGYDKCVRALSFHHVGDKNFEVAQHGCRSWESLKRELANCVLVCANCHMEIESGL